MIMSEKTSGWTAALRHLRRLIRSFETARDDKSSTWQFQIHLQRDELDGGWIAECVNFTGVVSEGETRAEALRNVADAIGEAVAVRMGEHLPISGPEDQAPDSTELALSV